MKLASQGIFWTIQGEGHLAGEPMIFIRLAGCSVGCPQCDTNYKHVSNLSVADIIKECERLRDENHRARYVWVTGGEPTDQPDLPELRDAIWEAGFKPCLATSGVKADVGVWWCVSVSPHTPTIQLKQASEVKLVPGLNGLDLATLDMAGWAFAHRFVQPLAGNKESLQACLDWLKIHDDYLMSPQSHKTWGLP